MMETIQNHKREFGIGAIILAVLLIFSFTNITKRSRLSLLPASLN